MLFTTLHPTLINPHSWMPAYYNSCCSCYNPATLYSLCVLLLISIWRVRGAVNFHKTDRVATTLLQRYTSRFTQAIAHIQTSDHSTKNNSMRTMYVVHMLTKIQTLDWALQAKFRCGLYRWRFCCWTHPNPNHDIVITILWLKQLFTIYVYLGGI